jgi:hypothetical protein
MRPRLRLRVKQPRWPESRRLTCKKPAVSTYASRATVIVTFRKPVLPLPRMVQQRFPTRIFPQFGPQARRYWRILRDPLVTPVRLT